MTIHKIYLKWLILVLLNAVVGIFFGCLLGQDKGIAWYIGMTLGIAAWWLIYSNIELFLKVRGYDQTILHMTIAAVIKMFMQVIYFFDMYIGIMVIAAIEKLNLMQYDIIAAYLATLGVGMVYGVIVLVIMGLAKLESRWRIKPAH